MGACSALYLIGMWCVRRRKTCNFWKCNSNIVQWRLSYNVPTVNMAWLGLVVAVRKKMSCPQNLTYLSPTLSIWDISGQSEVWLTRRLQIRYIILLFGSDQDIHVIVNIPRSIVCSDWTSCLLVPYICKGGNLSFCIYHMCGYLQVGLFLVIFKSVATHRNRKQGWFLS